MNNMKITIEGNRPVEILNGLRRIRVLDEYSHLDTDNTKFTITFKTPQPTFSVGMRVECIQEDDGFTKGMVYRLFKIEDDGYYLIDNDGYIRIFYSTDINFSTYFTPYEKPKEGDEYYLIYSGGVTNENWKDYKYDSNFWKLGLAFKTEEQAEFSRERLSKLF